ncbi:hypothetical protein AB1Y20_002901 [Prymnesium parvum]|uniref:FACT complex subunit n=1 Tax=Prymnesium parvum TaxID=97485 RepID=A0AB34JAW4_PRYPA
MVLSVPPLLEEMGQASKTEARQALAAWQAELWYAATTATTDARWMGTVEQLSSVIGGSVVVGGEGEEVVVGGEGEEPADVVPLSSVGVSTDPLMRLEGAPGQSGRYVLLSVVIGTSLGIWPAVISVGDAGGRDARALRDKDERQIELQVVAQSVSRIRFRLVDVETKARSWP